MFAIIGAIIIVCSVFGGFLIEGGILAVLIQPIELLIIFGAALGSLLISVPISVLGKILHIAGSAIKGKITQKEEYVELLMLLYELIKLGRTNALALEPQVDKPSESEIFKRYPSILHNHHVVEFICDTIKLQISSPISPYDLDDLLENDIAALHAEEESAPAAVNRIGDAMPGLGIVAAVLGVVLTMGKLTEGKEVIGHSVASALVGTFLGILMSYGFIQPLGAKMEFILKDESKLFFVTKAALLAYAKECNPKACVEFARRIIPPLARPTFKEIDEKSSNIGKNV
jgi:chemotaxis protein MotA